MTISSSLTCSLLTSYERLSRKPLLFKSFTAGLTLQEFDKIYEEIAKRYTKHEIQRLSKRKGRKRDIGTGRPFKLELENRFLMLLVYYRLYITYTLAGFLFDLDQSNICRDIQKIEGSIRKCFTNSTENIQNNKKAKDTRRSRAIFSGAFCLS